MNMITATEAHAQGSYPSLFFSIARNNPALAKEARRRAYELAGMLGLRIAVRGAAANDNGKKKRRAA